MTEADAWAIEAFIAAHAGKWRQIERASRGDHEFEDVESAARKQCYEWAAKSGQPIDWADAALVDRFKGRLYNQFVKYTEQHHRTAVRLDHPPPDVDGDRHPMADRLAVSSGDPLSLLMAAEDLPDDFKLVERAHSLAAAYVRLARHFRNDVRALADYLLISRSWTYRRLRQARTLAEQQAPIPFTPSRKKLPLPRPWRSRRVERYPEQLVLAFDTESPLLA